MANRAVDSTLARGQVVAALLAGAWRHSPPPLCLGLSALETAAPLLAAGSAGGLAWYRLRNTVLHNSSPGRELHQHFRLQTLQAVDRHGAICELLRRLRQAGVEPILIKGWSSACLYPQPALRPSGDVDLCVPADQIASAAAALSARPLPCPVDLHAEVPDLAGRKWGTIMRRSCLVSLHDTPVRVLGPEDRLRLLGLHLVRHGLARPLWLCDVGACLEALPADFDWDYCLIGSQHLSDWILCILSLAKQLLSARPIGPIPAPTRTVCPIPWMETAVYWCWGVGPGRSLRHYLRDPGDLMHRLHYHGISPNQGCTPIKAALHLGLGPTPSLPLLLIQVASFVRRKMPHVWQRLVHPKRRQFHPFIIH